MAPAADLIDYLLRRAQLRSPRSAHPADGFPAGWQRWFDAMGERVGTVRGTPPGEIVDLLARRPLATPPVRSATLSRWQAFNTLWRQDWQAPPREERRWHWTAVAISALWHLFFAGMLLWLMYLQYLLPPVRGGDTVVQVEYVGVGTPADAGGGPAPSAAAPAPAEAVHRRQADTPSTSALPDVPSPPVPRLAAPVPEIPQHDVAEPVEQPVEVSAPVAEPEPDDVVLPPMQRLPQPPIAPPELAATQPTVTARDIPEPLQARVPTIAAPALETRPIQSRLPEVSEREVPAPLPRMRVPSLPTPTIAPPELSRAAPAVPVRELPSVQPRPAPVPELPARDGSPSAEQPVPGAVARQPAGASAGARSPVREDAGQGAGPAVLPAPGAGPAARRADDLGEAGRERPGAESGLRSGLYDSEGRIRLPATPGSASPGRPPGTITQEIADLDRAGTWLKRRSNDYEPTMFDRVWRPNETLLQEWVRKSIKQVTIPIPGTSKSIVCNVAILAFGGGCDISDPDLNDQPAVARPPPDVPFKPELQEDNGSRSVPPKQPPAS